MPVAAQPTPERVSRSTRAVSRNELAFCRRLASGTRQSFIVMWPFWTTLSAILFSIFSTLKPGVVLFSTMKPLTWLSSTSRAQMIETSHQVRVADPLLLAVEDPGVAVALGGRGEAAAGAGADQRLGQAEAADLLEARHRRQPFLLLLLGAEQSDRAHGEAGVHAEESRERRVDRAPSPCATRPYQLRAVAVPPMPRPPMSSSFRRLDQLERERVLDPIFVDDRRDLGLHEVAHLLEDRTFLGAQRLLDLVEVAVRRRQLLPCAGGLSA